MKSLTSFALLVALLAPAAALGYTCKRADSVREAIKLKHDLVFKGEVLRVDREFSLVRFRIVHSYRGGARGEVDIHFDSNREDRPFAFEPGEVWQVSSLKGSGMRIGKPIDGFARDTDGGGWTCGLRTRVRSSASDRGVGPTGPRSGPSCHAHSICAETASGNCLES